MTPDEERDDVAARALAARLDRIEKAITTMAAWLVQAQTGFRIQDLRGIEDILKAPTDWPLPPHVETIAP